MNRRGSRRIMLIGGILASGPHQISLEHRRVVSISGIDRVSHGSLRDTALWNVTCWLLIVTWKALAREYCAQAAARHRWFISHINISSSSHGVFLSIHSNQSYSASTATMRLSFVPSLLLVGPILAAPAVRDDEDTAMTQFYALLAEASSNQAAYLQSGNSTNCTSSNVVVRRPW